jgi:hypothetical protein
MPKTITYKDLTKEEKELYKLLCAHRYNEHDTEKVLHLFDYYIKHGINTDTSPVFFLAFEKPMNELDRLLFEERE